MIVFTPINSHDLDPRSIVLGPDAEIEITVEERRPERDETAVVEWDGDHPVEVSVGDKIVIRRAQTRARILKLENLSFLQILRKKMHDSRE